METSEKVRSVQLASASTGVPRIPYVKPFLDVRETSSRMLCRKRMMSHSNQSMSQKPLGTSSPYTLFGVSWTVCLSYGQTRTNHVFHSTYLSYFRTFLVWQAMRIMNSRRMSVLKLHVTFWWLRHWQASKRESWTEWKTFWPWRSTDNQWNS